MFWSYKNEFTINKWLVLIPSLSHHFEFPTRQTNWCNLGAKVIFKTLEPQDGDVIFVDCVKALARVVAARNNGLGGSPEDHHDGRLAKKDVPRVRHQMGDIWFWYCFKGPQ